MGVFDVLSNVTGRGEDEDTTGESSPDAKSEPTGVRPGDLEPADFRERAKTLAGRSDVPELDFSEESLPDLDVIATGNHPVDEEITYGSYLGETLVREFDGEWVRDDGWGVAVYLGDEETTVSVFDAATMALERGPVFEQVAERLHAQGDPHAERGRQTASDDASTRDATTDRVPAGTADEAGVEGSAVSGTTDTAAAPVDGATRDRDGDREDGAVETSTDSVRDGDDETDADEPNSVADDEPGESGTPDEENSADEVSEGAAEALDEDVSADGETDRAVADDLDQGDVTAEDDVGDATNVPDAGEAVDEGDESDMTDDREEGDEDAVAGDGAADDAVQATDAEDDAADAETAADAEVTAEHDGDATADDPGDRPERTHETPDDGEDAEETAEEDDSGIVDARSSELGVGPDGPTEGDFARPIGDPITADANTDGERVEATPDHEREDGVPIDTGSVETATTDIPAEETSGDDAADDSADGPVASDANVADNQETEPADAAAPIPSRSAYEAAAIEFTNTWSDRDFDYSPESLARLDDFLDDQWDGRFRPGSLDDSSTDPEEASGPLVQVGAYVGEVLVRHYDGEWVAGDGGEAAVAVAGRHGRREVFPVFDATRTSLIETARVAYQVDAMAARLDIDRTASGAEETGFAIGEKGPGTDASSADVITTILDRAEEFVDSWPGYDLDYRPASLVRLDNLVSAELDGEAFRATTLGDWTDPDALRLADRSAGASAYFAAVLVRHLGAQWEIGDEVALSVEGPAGETRVVPFEGSVACLRGEDKFMKRYDRVHDAVQLDSRTPE